MDQTSTFNRATLALILAIGLLLVVFFSSQSFFDWAFERHQNTLSWFVRPVLLLPFCAFAFARSLNGILLSILAILTSMFWFPVPETVTPMVSEFLAIEKERLLAGFDAQNIFSIIGVTVFLAVLALAFWRRSVWLGAGVSVVGALLKTVWSVVYSPEGGQAVIAFALSGVFVLIIAVAIFRWSQHRRAAEKPNQSAPTDQRHQCGQFDC